VNRADIDRVTRGVVPTTHRRRSVWLKGYQAKVDALKRLQAETAAKLDALLPSVLDKTFKGEL
jgi:type I restriction enzyme S subunit